MSILTQRAAERRFDDENAMTNPLHHTRPTLLLLVLWGSATLIAAFFALLAVSSVYVDGDYIPLTNDSFYHARRILDAAQHTPGFYEYDERLHVPEGTWIPWPYGYDLLLAKATQVAAWLQPTLSPMAFLAHVPVVWVALNAALFLAAASALGLPLGMRALAMAGFAFSPLTQLPHSVGMIDHHYVEYTFVLLTAWLGLRWFARGDSATAAAALGVALGVAPMFHNGLFILQIPPLVCLLVLWLRDEVPKRRSLLTFSAVLVATALLSSLPSSALREGMFEFALLSWFHVYIAFCTSVTVAYLALCRKSLGSLAGLVAMAAALAVPIASQMWRGAAFFTRDITMLEQIVETSSVLSQIMESPGLSVTLSFYSGLLFLAPVVLVYFAWRAIRESDAHALFYALSVVMGVGLLLTQYRMHYFGQFALITGSLVIVDQLRRQRGWSTRAVNLVVVACFALAFYPPLAQRLFVSYPLAGDPKYEGARQIYLDLARLCAAEPGLVLSNSDDGNYILFHTRCSVIANNFILRPQDEVKLRQVHALMISDPQQLRIHEPRIRYLFLRAGDFSVLVDGEPQIVTGNALAKQLLIAEQPPVGFELIRAIPDATGERLYAKLFRVTAP